MLETIDDHASTRSRGIPRVRRAPIETGQRIRSLTVLSRRDRLLLAAITSVWAFSNLIFWLWWAQPGHVVSVPRFIIASIALAYDLTLMPAVFVFMLFKMRRPVPAAAPPGLRVAMVTAIVPSAESLDVLERTLAAMVAVSYPHHNVVLDEGGDNRVRELCQRYGASYFSRKGIARFNQPVWPFQAKTKSGNYNSWLSEVGYRDYDFIVQLDTDHAPVPTYLDDVLGYFSDPEIAYVALPSVYWNLDEWTARGSSEQSQAFQGPIQMGYFGWAGTPMIIGSHAAYRMSALRAIGGFAPSRAEDHLDTLRFAQKGYRGVFVPKVLATGLGPHTLADYLVQEHQWAFSIMQVLLKYGREKGLLTWRQRCVFLFSEIWYSLNSLCYLALFVLPLYALVIDEPVVAVSFIEFLQYSLPITISALVGVTWCYRKGWFRPGNHFFLSWQGIILTAARWPIVLVALVSAVISIVFRNGAFTYMVTPKGTRSASARDSIRVAMPFIVLAIIPIALTLLYPVIHDDRSLDAAGYILFALISAVLFTGLVIATTFDHVRVNLKARIQVSRVLAGATPLALIVVLLIWGIVAGSTVNRIQTVEALSYRERTAVINTTVETTYTESTGTTDDASVAPADVSPPHPGGASGDQQSLAAAGPDSRTTPAPLPPVDSWLFDPQRRGVTFGAYDPRSELVDLSQLDHFFTRWSVDGTGGIPVAAIRESYESGTAVMLTYEPWPLDDDRSGSILSDITAGDYDEILGRAARTVRNLEQPILLRFGHEMELGDLYPWAGNNPVKYQQAYRHVVTRFNEEGASNVIWVWSPAGTLDALDYYPGDAYVDYVGMTVLEYIRWEREAGYTPPREFKELINEKYQLLSSLGKPMLLAETGVALAPADKRASIQQMIELLPWFPQIRGVIYFNDQNPRTAAIDDRPVWTLSDKDRRVLAKSLDNLAARMMVEPSER